MPTPLPDLINELQRHTTADVRFDRISRTLYATDASNYQIMPLGVVIPRTAEDLAATVAVCADYKMPLLPRGGGSSLSGQGVGEAVIIDTSNYLHKLLDINAEARTVRVQPGLPLGQLNRRLRAAGLMIGPDPASADRACVGGCIGNNATGAHSILYGMFADHVLELKTILADGGLATFGPGRGSGRAAQLWDEVGAIIEANEAEIQAHWPRHWRRASGYNLNYLLPDAPYRHPGDPAGRPHQPNLAHLICGAEGTLAVIAEATLNLMPRPKMTALAILQFEDMVASMEAASLILELNPSAVEVMDRLLLELTRQQPQYSRLLTFVEGTPEALLMVEFYGESETELRGKLDHLEQHLKKHNVRCHVSRALEPEAQANVWAVRKVGLGIFMSARSDYKPIPVLEDFTVPAAALPGYVADLIALARHFDTELGIYGHASAGCLHIRPRINLKSARGVEIMKTLGEATATLVFKHGGVTSGEHGDGLQRSTYNRRLFGPTLYRALGDIKTIFDPDHRLNPGKIVEAPDPTANLRYGATYHAAPLPTFLDWSHEKGLDGAIEMCNGAGVCRKLDMGVMCPSYMATLEEQDTTRARANIFRAVLSGTLPVAAIGDRDVYEVFELCIGCKACKSECPSAVDMARIKTEFKAQYKARNGYSLRDYLIGNVPRLSKLAAALPGGLRLANLSLDLPPVQWLMGRLGIAGAREFPRFAPEPFSSWFRRRAGKLSSDKKVLLFNDTWTEYNYPHLGQAAVKVLEAAGYEVLLETQRACCGRPLLTTGFVEPVKPLARRNVDLLLPYVEQGLTIVGLEPSCILSFRDEYPALVDDTRRQAAHRLGQACLTIDEFLYRLIQNNELPMNNEAMNNEAMNNEGMNNEGMNNEAMNNETMNNEAMNNEAMTNYQLPITNYQSPNLPITQSPTLLFHGHCHQKALSDIKQSVAVLRAVGYEVTEIPSGCCGMAGNFGYEAEHYEISQKIGQDRLMPTIEAHPGLPVVANGISCREQVEHMTGRVPRHLVEFVADRVAGG